VVCLFVCLFGGEVVRLRLEIVVVCLYAVGEVVRLKLGTFVVCLYTGAEVVAAFDLGLPAGADVVVVAGMTAAV